MYIKKAKTRPYILQQTCEGIRGLENRNFSLALEFSRFKTLGGQQVV